MARLPSQWIAWDHTNVLGPDDGAPDGQFLYALKDTAAGDRQVVLEAGSDRGVIAVVDFAGFNRKRGAIYYAWGKVTYLGSTIPNAVLGADPALQRAFANRHGRAKRLATDAARRLDELAQRLPPQRLPPAAPGEAKELDLWVGAHGRAPEFLIHDEVETTRRLWKRVGSRTAPRRDHRLANGKFPDLYSPDGVVGEVKNFVGPKWGPDQILGYMRQLDKQEPHRAPWRGILIHGGDSLSPATRHALEKAGASITVWSIRPKRWGGSRATRQYP